jgi:predicted RNA binding protein YcfA (HicA-like mRNA interferase family)
MHGSFTHLPVWLPGEGELALARKAICGKLPPVPRKIRQLVTDLENAGFRQIAGGKGSHRKFIHPKFRGFVLISGHDGDDARYYQEKHVRTALRQVEL